MSECKEVVIIIRPSFKKMLSDDACRAAVFNHFLYWIAKKVKGGSEYWYGSFDEIWESLDRSWGLSKTIQEIKALVADGFIGQRRNPKNGWDQTRHYFFEKEQGETLRATCEKFGICLAHIGLSPDVLHLLKITNAFDENNKCICSNQQIDLLDLPDRFVESNDAIPKVSTKDYTKGLHQREREVADATARSQSSQEISLSEDTVKREAVKASPILAVRLIDGTEALAQVEKREGDTLRVIWLEPQKQYVQAWSNVFGNKHFPFESTLPSKSDPHYTNHGIQAFGEYRILSKKEIDGLSIIPLYRRIDKKEVVDGHAHQHRASDNHLLAHSDLPDPVQSQPRQDTNKNTEPPHPRKPRSNPTIPKRPRPQQQELTDEIPAGAHSKPVEPHADMAWGTRKCLQWFDYWRGGVLIAKYKLQQAASCAKGLAEQFDEATVIRIRGDMADDPYYIERGGPDICDVANNIHKYLNKKKPKKEPSNEHRVSSFGQPGYNFADEFYPSEAEKKAYYAAHPIGEMK